MRIVLITVFTIAALAAFATPAAAQPRPQAPPALEQLFACDGVTDREQRFACYEANVARLREAYQTGDVVAIDRGQAQTAEREAFGFSLPSLPQLFARSDRDPSAVTELTLQIAEVRRRPPSDTLVLTMSNGQVWEQTDTTRTLVRPGMGVTVRRAAFATFLMSPDNGAAAFRAERRR